MPEETAPAPEQETPKPPESGPDTGTPAEASDASPAPDDNSDKRIADFQRIATQAQQEAAQVRDLVTRAQQGDVEAAQALGFEFADTDEEEPEDEYEDPDDRLDRLEQALTDRQAQEAQAKQEQDWLDAAESHVNDQRAALEKEHGKLDEEEFDYLLRLGAVFANEDGYPDLAEAFRRDSQRFEAKRQGWVSSKRRPQAPSGASPSSQPDLDKPEDRRQWMAEQFASGG